MDDRSRVIWKIRKILMLARENENENELELAIDMAKKMCKKYDVTIDDLIGRSGSIAKVRFVKRSLCDIIDCEIS